MLTQSDRRGDAPPATPISAVVGDEFALARYGVVTMLESFGVEVLGEAQSARELLALASDQSIGVVVVGALGDGEAVDVVRRCKNRPSPPTVIVLLGPRDQVGAAAHMEVGADGVLSRNATVDELGDSIARVLNGERVVGAQLAKQLAGSVNLATPIAADGLSAREREMLVFLAQGATNRDIATALSLSVATIKTHLVHLYAKLGVSNRNDALGVAVARGLFA